MYCIHGISLNRICSECASDGASAPILILRYETDAMAEIRRVLDHHGQQSHSIDHFKDCLIILEQNGFTLTKSFKA